MSSLFCAKLDTKLLCNFVEEILADVAFERRSAFSREDTHNDELIEVKDDEHDRFFVPRISSADYALHVACYGQGCTLLVCDFVDCSDDCHNVLTVIINRRRPALKRRPMSAFSFAGSDSSIDPVCFLSHNFTRARGLVTVDIGAFQYMLRGASDALRETGRLALGGHWFKT